MYLFHLDRMPGYLSMLLFHELAREDVEALVIVSPAKPMISIGYFQDAQQEVNLEYLREHQLPLFRREVGGGTVYLDQNQIFYQVIYGKDYARLPQSVQEAYQVLSEPPVRAHGRFGIQAQFREVNDLITKEGRKIGGEGGANIANSLVFVGSMMMDFDYRTMANVAKIPDEKWRDKVFQSIEENVTTMKRELGALPDRYDVQRVLIEEFEKVLGPLERAPMPAWVVKRAQALGKQMLDPSFLLGKRKSRVDSFKVKSNTHLLFGSHKARGGLIRSVAEVEGPDLGGLIQDVSLSGDFTLIPKESISDRLEPAIRGAIRREKEILPKVEEFFAARDLEMPGVEAKDVVKALGLESES